MEAKEELHYLDKAEEKLRGRYGGERQGREIRRPAVGEPGGNGAAAPAGRPAAGGWAARRRLLCGVELNREGGKGLGRGPLFGSATP